MKNHSFNHKSFYAPPSGGDGRGAFFNDLHVGGTITAHHHLNVLGDVHIAGALTCAQVNNLDCGFFASEQALLAEHPLPVVGMRATVIQELSDDTATAIIYGCEQTATWRILARQVPVTVSWQRSSLPNPSYSIPLTHFKVLDSLDQLPFDPYDRMTGFVVDGTIYVFVATGGDTRDGRYLSCGPLHGIQGERGPQGEQGLQGIQGERGPQGIQGNTGVSIGDNYELFTTLAALDGKSGNEKAVMVPDGNVVEEMNMMVDNLASKKTHTNRYLNGAGASVQPDSGNGNRLVVVFNIAPYAGYTIDFSSYINYDNAIAWAVYQGDTTFSKTGLSQNTDVRLMSGPTARGTFHGTVTVQNGDKYLVVVCYAGHSCMAMTTKAVKTILLEDSARLSTVEDRLDTIETHGLGGINHLNSDRDGMVANLGYYARTLRLLHFSDLHHDPANMQRIMDWYNAHDSDIDDILNTGDIVNTHYGATGYAGVEGVERILNTIGNHDIDSDGGGHYAEHAGIDGYNAYIKPYVAHWGVTQPADAEAEGRCYYYKDYTAQGIRLIVLDTIVAYTRGSAQQTWFQDVLADAKERDLSVVVAAHWIAEARVALSTHFAPHDEARASGNADSVLVNDDVQAFIDGGGKFICHLVGHGHADHIGTMKEHPRQLCIMVGAANGLDATNILHVNHGGEVRRQGTRSQDNFNVVGINTDRHTVTLVKIGVDTTVCAQHKDFVCINYLTLQEE